MLQGLTFATLLSSLRCHLVRFVSDHLNARHACEGFHRQGIQNFHRVFSITKPSMAFYRGFYNL